VTETNQSTNKIIPVIRWIIGGFLLVIGTLSIITMELLPALLLFALGLFITPLSEKYLFGKLKFVVPTWAKVVVSVILLLAFVWALPSSDTQPKTNIEQANQISFASGQVTEETIRAEIERVRESGYRIELDDISKVEVIKQYKESEDLPDTYAVSIFYTFDAWDNEDVINTSAASSLELFRRLFAHPQIVRVATFAEQDFTDQYGKTETTTAVKFIMERETADKIEWNGMKDRVLSDYKALFPLTEYTIHGAIRKDLE